jgi:hypothetical protein
VSICSPDAMWTTRSSGRSGLHAELVRDAAVCSVRILAEARA